MQRPSSAALSSVMQVLGRARALTALNISFNFDLELHVEDVDAVFAHLRRLCTLHMYRGEDMSGEDPQWSLGAVKAIIRLCRECPGLDVDVGWL